MGRYTHKNYTVNIPFISKVAEKECLPVWTHLVEPFGEGESAFFKRCVQGCASLQLDRLLGRTLEIVDVDWP